MPFIQYQEEPWKSDQREALNNAPGQLINILQYIQDNKQAKQKDIALRQAAAQMIGMDVPEGMGEAAYGAALKAKLEQAADTNRSKAFRDLMINVDKAAPNGFEIVGYDQKGNPMIRKQKSDLAERKYEDAQAEKEQENQKQVDFIKSRAADTLQTIENVKKGTKYFGFAGGMPSFPMDYDRKEWENNINKLLASKVVDLITDMKSASKTGATGFGQLSEREGALLRDASTALKRDISPENAANYLSEMENPLRKILGDTSTPSQDEIMAELKRRGKM